MKKIFILFLIIIPIITSLSVKENSSFLNSNNYSNKDQYVIISIGLSNLNAGPDDFHYKNAETFSEIMSKSKLNITVNEVKYGDKELKKIHKLIAKYSATNTNLIVFISGHASKTSIGSSSYSYNLFHNNIKKANEGKTFFIVNSCDSYANLKYADGLVSTNELISQSSYKTKSFTVALFDILNNPKQYDKNQDFMLTSFEIFKGIDEKIKYWKKENPELKLRYPAIKNNDFIVYKY